MLLQNKNAVICRTNRARPATTRSGEITVGTVGGSMLLPRNQGLSNKTMVPTSGQRMERRR